MNITAPLSGVLVVIEVEPSVVVGYSEESVTIILPVLDRDTQGALTVHIASVLVLQLAGMDILI